ncbi:MAG: hypothetical protein PVI16_04695 [Gammaproteobacteria bacterium]|jgi:hypothetical protein
MLLAGQIVEPAHGTKPQPSVEDWMQHAVERMEEELVSRYGEDQAPRIRRGLAQVASFWRTEDGGPEIFENFTRINFAGDQQTLDRMFGRFQFLLENLDGRMNQIILAMRWQADLDLGPLLPMDGVAAGYDPSDHINDDLFANKLAFAVLLNFPLTTLEERLANGEGWTRRQWAEARLAQRFARRIPADVQQRLSRVSADTDAYIAGYNIWMDHVLDSDGRKLFPEDMKLLAHWNLRDQIKADYGDDESGLAKQRTIQRIMERIVDQSIPAVVIDNPGVDWNPWTNQAFRAGDTDGPGAAVADRVIAGQPEPDTRYVMLLNAFRAQRDVDAYSPTAPNFIRRRFDEGREITEERAAEMFRKVLASPLLEKVARLIEERLGRPLEPFDIWYDGFHARGAYSESALDDITRERYPNPEAFAADMPRMLIDLGFSEDKARQIASHIAVDPARGSGHAWGASMKGAKSRLRTRVGSRGMDYKGYNIAVHEFGHNVEQTISLYDVEYYSLAGVPNTAFTEAAAFVFQSRDLELLGLSRPDLESRSLEVIGEFWGTAEIAAVALVDMGVWHWMYEHPDATPAELKLATIQIARDVWNDYYAPLFGVRDVTLLAVYSHMIHSFLYLPDYPIGHMIARQVKEHLEKAEHYGTEFERLYRIGDVSPDLWMKNATGDRVGPEALLNATGRALEEVTAR